MCSILGECLLELNSMAIMGLWLPLTSFTDNVLVKEWSEHLHQAHTATVDFCCPTTCAMHQGQEQLNQLSEVTKVHSDFQSRQEIERDLQGAICIAQQL